jgi:alpha-beta hydrolase superfamily lysophospholipase
MDWKITSFLNFLEHGNEEIEKVISLYPDRDIYFWGFSFGAVIALSNAGKYESKGTLICSLSPIFQDDLKLKPQWLKAVIQLVGFSPPNYNSIPEQATVFLQGDHDNSMIISDEILSRRERLYPKSKFKIIEGAEHDITGDAYLEEIKKEIYKLREEAKNE